MSNVGLTLYHLEPRQTPFLERDGDPLSREHAPPRRRPHRYYTTFAQPVDVTDVHRIAAGPCRWRSSRVISNAAVLQQLAKFLVSAPAKVVD